MKLLSELFFSTQFYTYYLVLLVVGSCINNTNTQSIHKDSLLQSIRNPTAEDDVKKQATLTILAHNKALWDTSLQADSSYAIEQLLSSYAHKTDSLNNKLYQLILSPKHSEASKKKAIDILIRSKAEYNLHFLVEHMAKVYFPTSYMGADDEFDGYYIFIQLHQKALHNWALVPLIINNLKNDTSDLELFFSAELLFQIVARNRELYLNVIQAHLLDVSEILSYNLSQLAKYVE